MYFEKAILIPLSTPNFSDQESLLYWEESLSLYIKLSYPWYHSPSTLELKINNDDRRSGRESIINGNGEDREENPV